MTDRALSDLIDADTLATLAAGEGPVRSAEAVALLDPSDAARVREAIDRLRRGELVDLGNGHTLGRTW